MKITGAMGAPPMVPRSTAIGSRLIFCDSVAASEAGRAEGHELAGAFFGRAGLRDARDHCVLLSLRGPQRILELLAQSAMGAEESQAHRYGGNAQAARDFLRGIVQHVSQEAGLAQILGQLY